MHLQLLAYYPAIVRIGVYLSTDGEKLHVGISWGEDLEEFAQHRP